MNVEEKRSRNVGSSTTVADAVHEEITELDQEGRAESELLKEDVSLKLDSKYLKHLSDSHAHNLLLHDLQEHMWLLKQAQTKRHALEYFNEKLRNKI